MTYQQTVLNSKPAGFWMLTAPSGSTETDLSGNGKNATITDGTNPIDRVYRPLVTGTSSDRAFRFLDQFSKLTYPALEIWEVNRDHISFSVELTYQWIDGVREQVLFAPQEASATGVWNNGIFQQDGLLRFAISDGLTKRAEASYQIEPGRTYHIVAMYDQAKVYLYVDGVLVAEDVKPPGLTFRHTVANFITIDQRGNLDPATDQFLIDAVSVYRRTLTPHEINNHYVNSTPNLADLDLVNSLNGKLIKANQEDMTAILNFSARTRGWLTPLNELKDLQVNSQGDLSLKQIKPAKLFGSSSYYGNLLTLNQASIETDTTGFTTFDAAPSFARSTAQASSGQASMLVTTNSTSISSVGTTFPTSPAIKPGATYTAHMAVRQNVFTSGTYRLYIVWRDRNGILVSSIGGSLITPSTSFQRTTTTAVAPATAAFASPAVLVSGHASGDSFYFDELGLWEGSATTWAPPTQQSHYSDQEINANGNYVKYNPATADVDTSDMSNTNPVNNTLTRDTTQMYSGTASWKVAVTGATTVSLTPTPIAVKPGYKYTHMAKGIGTTARTMNQYINWYDASNTLIGNGGITGVTLSTSAWTQVRRVVTAPPHAVRADIYTQIPSAVNTENYWFDEFGLFEGDVSTWSAPIFNADEVDLKDSRIVLADQIGQHLGAGQGAIGGFVDLTAAANDHAGEQVIASVSNSLQSNYFEIVKKADKSLYLRYVYRNQAGAITTVEKVYGAISGLLATQAYYYLEWNGSTANLYINDTSANAEIAFEPGIPAPQFDFDSFMVIGGGADSTRTWNTYHKWAKIYDKTQPTADFIYNKNSVNGYTLKFNGNLYVSQQGSATLQIPTGSDGSEDISGTAIEYAPRNSSIIVKTSTDAVNNLLTYNQATVEDGTTGFTIRGTGAAIVRSLGQHMQGAASIALTTAANTGQGVNAGSPGSNPNGFPTVYGGKSYTATVFVRSAAVARNFKIGLAWWNAANGFISETLSADVLSTTSGWTQLSITLTAPATAAFGHVYVQTSATPAAGEVHYFDEFGLMEGTSNTWGVPYQTAPDGSEAVASVFEKTLPANYYAAVQLSTDDSYYNVETLRDLKVKAFEPDTIYAENAFDELVSRGRSRVFEENMAMIRQGVNNGIFVDGQNNNFYIKRVVDSNTVAIPDGGTVASTAGPTGDIRTLEFWVRPEVQGYIFYYDGTTEYSMRYYNAGGFTTTGFTKLYVDGVDTANAVTLGTWYNRWHHIVLTNSSAQINLAADAPAGENLVSANQASVETDLTGIEITQGTGTLSRVADATAAHGGAYSRLTITAASAAAIGTPQGGSANKVPAVPGETYTGQVTMRTTSTAITMQARLFFLDVNGTQLGNALSAGVAASNVWKTETVSMVAPANTVYAMVSARNSNSAISDVIDVDKMGIWKGSSAEWTMPGTLRAINMLTPNQASVETNTTGLGAFQATVARVTSPFFIGTASLEITPTVANVVNVETTGIKYPVVPGRTYTSYAAIKTAAVTTATAIMSIWWYDKLGNQLAAAGPGATAISNTQWQERSYTAVAPEGAAYAGMLMQIRGTFAIGDIMYMDKMGFWEGSSTAWSAPDPKGWFGAIPVGGNQATARYQNIAYYPQAFAAGDVTANLDAYLGNATGGSISDTVGTRTISDSVNLLTLNQATAETDLTGVSNGAAAVTRITSDKDEGLASFQAVKTSGAGQAIFTMVIPGSNTNNVIPVSPGDIFALAASVKATVGGAMAGSFKLTVFDSGMAYLTDRGVGFTTSGSWQRVFGNVTMPANAAFVTLQPYFTAGATNDTVLWDRMMVAKGTGNTWVAPVLTGTNPKTFANLWEIQAVPVR